MRIITKILVSVFILAGGLISLNAVKLQDKLTVDFKMVEKGIQWLELIKTGADDETVKNYFMTHVAPTAGSQSIIHHWSRFRDWNNETFYDFIMTALGRKSTNEKFKKEDGTLTALGNRKKLWTQAIQEIDRLKKDLETLKTIDFDKLSIQRAKHYLPPEAVLEADFYFVLFGHSNAFSVGKENGFDFLQLPRKANGEIDMERLADTFAHEMHHTGFDYLMKLHPIENKKETLLLGVLAAEGMPTYYIDQPWKHLGYYKTNTDTPDYEVAMDWERHTNRLNELYKEAENDIGLNREGKIGQKEIMGKWMAGYKGAAYVLGADMIGVIDRYLGREKAISIASDYRKLLTVYNQAAKKARENGNNLFVFDNDIATSVTN